MKYSKAIRNFCKMHKLHITTGIFMWVFLPMEKHVVMDYL